MRILSWIRQKILGRPTEMQGIPDILGYTVDESGEPQPIHRGDVRHISLTPEQVERVARLREVLAEAYPMTMEGWVDGFLRDVEPENEIQIIEAVASVYSRLVAEARLSVQEKRTLYGVLCAMSAGIRTSELLAMIPSDKGLPAPSVVIRMYEEARRERKRP